MTNSKIDTDQSQICNNYLSKHRHKKIKNNREIKLTK